MTCTLRLAPGRFEHIGISRLRLLDFDDVVRWTGPGALAFDGERERILKAGQTASIDVPPATARGSST